MNEESLLRLLKATALTGAGFFACGNIIISFVDVPTRKSLGTTHSVTHLQAEFYKLAVQQVSALVISGVSGVWAGKILLASNPKLGKQFLTGGFLILSVIPYTAIFMRPNLRYVLDPNVDKASSKTAEELDKWGKLHFVRTAISGLALLVLSKAVFY